MVRAKLRGKLTTPTPPSWYLKTFADILSVIFRARPHSSVPYVYTLATMIKSVLCREANICAHSDEFRHFIDMFSVAPSTKRLFLCVINGRADSHATVNLPSEARAKNTRNSALHVARHLPASAAVLLNTEYGLWSFSRDAQPVDLSGYVSVCCAFDVALNLCMCDTAVCDDP